MSEGLSVQYPETNADQQLIVVPEIQARPEPSMMGVFPLIATVFMGLVGLVLLAASASVANLLLGRASARRQELAVRAALGASRGRLLRQMLTETLLLALVGGLVGLGIATWISNALAWLIGGLPVDATLNLDFRPDLRVFVFTLVITGVTALLTGAVPALLATRQSGGPGLVSGLRGIGASGGGRVRSTLVVAQVAVSMVLLVAAALFLQSMRGARSIDVGLRAESTLYSPAGFSSLTSAAISFPKTS